MLHLEGKSLHRNITYTLLNFKKQMKVLFCGYNEVFFTAQDKNNVMEQ